MNGYTEIQREWLTEDLAQIRRYFPGATLLGTLDTPFDLEIRVKSQEVREETALRHDNKPVRSAGASEKNERTARAAADKAAGEVRVVHERQRYGHPKRSELLLQNTCASLGAII